MKMLPLFEAGETSPKHKAIVKKIEDMNKIITVAVDGDGDKLEVFDNSSTWESPMTFEPIAVKGNIVTILSTDDRKPKKEIVNLNKEFDKDDLNATLTSMKRWYRTAYKKAGITFPEQK